MDDKDCTISPSLPNYTWIFMGSLTAYLQEEFQRHCPPGWISRSEVHLLPRNLENLLGYAPRADVVLEKQDQTTSLWIEFEISRADPVANHVKFATSHIFQPQGSADTFIAMISPHVALGRRNLAANTIHLMRHIGMRAFQTVLFPSLSGEEIKQLNHLDKNGIKKRHLDVQKEIERILLITEKLAYVKEHSIYFISDISDVMLNLNKWNSEISTDRARLLWGKRIVTYFVFESRSKSFAPSKFCAYVGISSCALNLQREIKTFPNTSPMTIEVYTGLDQTDPRFDGRRARIHLTKNLGMEMKSPNEDQIIAHHFESWLHQHKDFITVHPNGPHFIIPPRWFT